MTPKQDKYWDENRIYTLDEYFELAEKAPFKTEFLNGKVRLMPGGTINHGTIISNVNFQLRIATKKLEQKVRVYNSEIQIYIKPLKTGTYPDGSVVIGESEYFKKDKAITNPAILFEVLSDSTGGYDRGEKFRKYKKLASFQEYVLIEQDQPVIDVLYKNEDGIWEMHSFIGLEDELELRSINVKIPLSDIYEDAKDLVLPQHKIDLE
jgi:Uma2 family endonuclease